MSGEDDTDAGTETQTEAPSPEVIRQARDMGWVPPDEWRGSPPKNGFLDPQEYVRRGEKIMPIVRAENAKLKEQISRLQTERDTDRTEHSKTIARIERMSSLALDQQRAQIEEKYADRIEKAAEVGDKAGVTQARKDEKEALAALDKRLEEPEETKTAKGAELPKPIQETINAWKADNAWYREDGDDEMSMVAARYHMKLQNEKRGLTLAENLAEVSKYIRKRYPEEFSAPADEEVEDDDPKPRRGSPVEGGSRNSGGGGSATAWSKVPPDVRKSAEAAGHIEWFLKSGETIEKDASKARERWAAKYFEGERA